jgi:AcrR family transcriptional regulator
MNEERQLTSQGQERKDQLLEHAARLFAERGYADTRILDICRAAGVAKGLFYWYFENKEQLFRELAEGIRLRLRRTQGDAIDPSVDALTQIRQGTEASVRFMLQHGPFFSLLEAENVQREFGDTLKKGTDVHVSDVSALVRRGISDGLIREDDPVLLARGVVGTVGVYSQFHRTGRIDLPVDELAAFVARFVVHSLAADDHVARAVLAPLIASTNISQ